MKLEVCCADIDSVRAAKAGGADRVELCEDLEVDGLTPQMELIRKAVETGIRVHVLIRPRPGDFVFSDEETQEMEESIRMAKSLGAQGVVIGALDKCGDIDENVCRRLVAAAEGVSVTFHRAFDSCRNPREALKVISKMGCDRLLTSGQAATALKGVELLKELVKMSAELSENRRKPLVIMPGAGVNVDNVRTIVNETGATEVHGSLRSTVAGRKVTTIENVRRVVEQLS